MAFSCTQLCITWIKCHLCKAPRASWWRSVRTSLLICFVLQLWLVYVFIRSGSSSKYQRTGWLINSRNLCISHWEAWLSKIKVLVCSVSGGTDFLVHRWLSFLCLTDGWGKGALPSWPDLLPKAPPPNPIALEVKISIYAFREGTSSLVHRHEYVHQN